MGDLLDLNLATLLGEELCRRGEDPLAVAAGVGPLGSGCVLLDGAQSSP
jgi:hypothetical protein